MTRDGDRMLLIIVTLAPNSGWGDLTKVAINPQFFAAAYRQGGNKIEIPTVGCFTLTEESWKLLIDRGYLPEGL